MAEAIVQIPGKVYFGSDLLNLTGSLVSEFGNRVLFIGDYPLHEGRHIEKVLDALQGKGLQCILIDDLGTYGSTRTFSDVVEFAQTSRIEVVLAMGGIRTLFAGRNVASRYKQIARTPEGQRVSYMEIPTVFRYPFLLLNAYLEFDPTLRRLQVLQIPADLFKGALIDPGTMAGLSSKYAGTLLMDTLLHALEGYVSPEINFLSETVFQGALQRMGDALEEVMRGEKNLRHRVKAAHAGVLISIGYTTLRMGPGIALSYALNNLFGIPKSWAGAVLLPHFSDAYSDTHPELLSQAAQLLGEDTFGVSAAEAAASVSARIRRAMALLGLPSRLRDFDLKLNKLVEAAEAAAALDGSPFFHIPLSVDSLYDFLKRAY